MIDYSDKLRELVNKHWGEDWSIRQLARRSEMSSTHVSDVLGGRAKPGLEFCKGLARALRIPPEDVLREIGLLPYIPPEVHQSDELLHYFTQLPPDDRQRIITMTRALYEERAKYKTEDQ